MAVRIQAGATCVADQTVIPEAQENQPQIVLLPDSREMDGPPPPYDQTVNPVAQENQPQIVLLPDPREIYWPPPPFAQMSIQRQRTTNHKESCFQILEKWMIHLLRTELLLKLIKIVNYNSQHSHQRRSK